jgi:hypothetical protein
VATSSPDNLFIWMHVQRFKTPKGDDIRWQRWLAEIYRDESVEMCVQKCSQARISTYAIYRVLHFTIANNATVVFTEPTRDQAQKFSGSRVHPLVEQHDYLKGRVSGGTELLRVRGAPEEPYRSHIHFRGTTGEREAISVDADEVVVDEVDESNQTVVASFETRLIASKWKRKLFISTPSFPRYGINAYWSISDQMTWLWKCPGCGREINPQADHFKIIDAEKARYVCYHCGKVLDKNIINADPALSRWVPARPGAHLRGYQITQAMMNYVTVASLVEAQALQKPRKFQNFWLGGPSDEGVGQVTRDMIEGKCLLDRHARSHQAVARRRAMGVDQGDRIYCEISEIDAATGRSHIVDLPTTRTWEDLYRLMNQHEIECCVIDARPEIRLARQFARDFPGRVFCCEYANIHEPVLWVTGERYFIQANRTQALDAAAEDIAAGVTQLYWPRDDDIDGEGGGSAERGGVLGFIQHWESERRIEPEEDDGLPTWKEIGPDHRAHADVYRKIAESRIRGKPINEMWTATAGTRIFTPSPALSDLQNQSGAPRVIRPQEQLPAAPQADLGRPPARTTLYRGRG